jgi:hypothetical protein
MNNASNDCPPLMSDSRHATDWRTSCSVHGLILDQNAINNSHDARSFLQKNAIELMKNNSKYFKTKNGCNCTDFHVDPNGHDKYWSAYHKKLGYISKKAQ